AWTKSRADTLGSLNRLLADFLALADSVAEKRRAAEENDRDVAAVLAAIDRRIVELAGAFAGRLGGEEPASPAGGEGGGGVGVPRPARTISARPVARQLAGERRARLGQDAARGRVGQWAGARD